MIHLTGVESGLLISMLEKLNYDPWQNIWHKVKKFSKIGQKICYLILRVF